ncbi:MAG TPA: DUF5133 domain-containing protein [Streptomyces sp.]
MLHPTSGALRAALSRHADAVIEDERRSTPGTARRREDTAYTLCVMTGVTDVRQALIAADALLRAGTPEVATAPDGGMQQPAAARLRHSRTAAV